MSAPRTGTLALAWVLVYGVWGSAYLAMQVAGQSLGPLCLSALRGLGGGALLYLLLRVQGGQLPSWRAWRQWRDNAGIGILIVGISSGLLAWGVQGASSGLVAVLFSTMPIFACLLGAALQRTLPWRVLAGTLAGIGGIALVYRAELGLHAQELLAAAVLGAAAVTAWASVWTERGHMPPHVLAAASMQLLTGGAAAGLAAWGMNEPQGPWTISAAGALLYLSAAVSAGGFWAFNVLTQHAGATAASTYAYINPLVALALGLLWKDERLSNAAYAGMALVLFGVYLVIAPRAAQRLR